MKLEHGRIADLSNEEIQQSNTRSKGLISIDESGRPLLDYLLFNAKQAGYKTIYIITGVDNSLFKTYYGNNNFGNSYHGLTINFAIQHIPKDREKPLGTADAVYQTIKQYNELKTDSFTVCNSDNFYSIEAFKSIRLFDESPNVLLGYSRKHLKFSEEKIAKFAVIHYNNNGSLIDIVEKPDVSVLNNYRDTQGTLHVSMNIFKFDGFLFFQYLKKCPIHKLRNEKELPTALLNMINDHPNSTRVLPIAEHVPDLTSKEDILIMKNYVSKIDLSDW